MLHTASRNMPEILQKGNTEKKQKRLLKVEHFPCCSVGAVTQRPPQSACEDPFGNKNHCAGVKIL